MPDSQLLLAIDTCGPTGSVALGRMVAGQSVEILGQTELEGRSYSSTLIAAVSELLERAGITVSQLHAMVTVNGPGSFTGVRVGLATIKGLAEPARIPVVAVSRLEVLTGKVGLPSAALDAHRHEIYLRIGLAGAPTRELLAGAHELAEFSQQPLRIAVCDEASASVLSSTWPAAELLHTAAPTAADALALCVPRIAAREFADLALLDGHYLRRSDAEIFGQEISSPAAALEQPRP